MNTLKNIIGIICGLLISCVAVAQNTTIQFVGKDRTGNDYVRLNHVSVFDEDQLWHEMLYYPDTSLFLGPVSVEDYAMQDFRLMQNVPNPFEGITDIALSLPDVRDVTLEIYDMLGKVLVKQSFPSLQEGTHLFRASMTSPQTYLLSATTKDGKTSIKMVNEGVAATNSIEYIGMTNPQGGLSLFLNESKGAGSYPFNIGDKMKYTGYALIDDEMRSSEVVQKKQYNNETIQLKFDVERPLVETGTPYSLSASSLCFNGEVTSDNNASVTERGFCYATHNTPTLNDSWISVGTGVGLYTTNVTDLTAGTVYFVRAYAINAIGLSYGSSKSIRTQDTIPEVTTTVPSQITATAFVTGGEVLTDNGSSVTARGVCWGIFPNPTLADDFTNEGSGLGSFTSNINGLNCGTTYYVRAYAINSVGTAYGETYSVITLSTGIPEITSNNVSEVTSNSAVCGGVVTHDGCDMVTARGVCWSTSQNPTINDSHTTDGTGMGSFTSNLTGLSYATTYYVRAFATNGIGTSYGETMTFITNPIVPTVSTNSVTDITATSFVCGGNVTSDGGAVVTARGLCWSTTPNPTIADSSLILGNGLGAFTGNITDLTCSTTYYVRAFATNSVGTAYGEEYSMTTSTGIPEVTTNNISEVTSSSAVCGGVIAHDGCNTITSRGVCWSTSQNPTVSDSHTTDGSGTGSFTSSITGLIAGTTYYVRAYATNSVGTNYGEQRSFTTANGDGEPCPGAATVTDYDNNTYNTVKIGDQCWMKENLRTTHYSNGTSIALGSSTSTTTAYRYYPNNSSSNVSTYGYLYNWKAVMRNSSSSSANPSGVQGICPTGWHVPSDAEWTQLTNYVSSQTQYQCDNSSDNNAKALASTTGWNSSSTTCAVGNNPSTNNATGFSALPAGYYTGIYSSFGENADFWSATENDDSHAYGHRLRSFNAYVYRFYGYKLNGFSVRCVKDAGGNTATVPTVTTTSVTSITANSATCGGNVTSDGGATVTVRGVCWSTSQNPTVSDSHTNNGSDTGSFTSSITGLTASTTYYVRAYATNSVGTAYGSQVSFTTTSSSGADGQPCPGAATVTDYDNNTYNTVKIGNQCWMKENLRTTHYSNGTSIALGSSTSTSTAYRYYPNNSSSNVSTYGYLYNWKAVMRNSSSSSANPSGVTTAATTVSAPTPTSGALRSTVATTRTTAISSSIAPTCTGTITASTTATQSVA